MMDRTHASAALALCLITAATHGEMSTRQGAEIHYSGAAIGIEAEKDAPRDVARWVAAVDTPEDQAIESGLVGDGNGGFSVPVAATMDTPEDQAWAAGLVGDGYGGFSIPVTGNLDTPEDQASAAGFAGDGHGGFSPHCTVCLDTPEDQANEAGFTGNGHGGFGRPS